MLPMKAPITTCCSNRSILVRENRDAAPKRRGPGLIPALLALLLSKTLDYSYGDGTVSSLSRLRSSTETPSQV